MIVSTFVLVLMTSTAASSFKTS